MAQQVIQMSRYKHPLPTWFTRIGFVALYHAKDLEFFSALAAKLGVDEAHPVINFATALSRKFGLKIDELAALFTTISTFTGQVPATCYDAVMLLGVADRQRDALLIDTSLERAVAAAEFSWQRDSVMGARFRAAREGCRSWLAGIRQPCGGRSWEPTELLMGVVSVLIEAVRLQAGGVRIDHRESKWQGTG